MMHCCWGQSWTGLPSLSGSVSRWLCCLPKNVFSCPQRTNTQGDHVRLSWRCGRAFLCIVAGESSPVTAAAKWNGCFPTCTRELIGFCNTLPSPWPLGRPHSSSVQWAGIYSTLIRTTMPGQKVIATDFWPVSVNSAGHGYNYIQSRRSWTRCNVYSIPGDTAGVVFVM